MLDALDLRILRFLTEDGRTPYAHIAKELNISDVAVKKRVEKLVQRGIIKKIRAELDLKKIGFRYFVFVEIKPEPQEIQQVFRKILEYPNVLEAHIVVGEYPILVKAVCEDIDAAREFIESVGKLDGVLELKTAISLESESKPIELPAKLAQRTLGA